MLGWYWVSVADVGQQQPSIGLMSRVCRDGFVSSGHSFGEGPQQRRDIEYVLVQCWPIVSNAGPTLKQHKGNVTCLLGSAHDANRSVTIQLDEGWQTSLCVTVEPLLYGHHYCKPKMAVQDKWPLIGGHVFSKKKVSEIWQWWPDKASGVSIFTSSSKRPVTDAAVKYNDCNYYYWY